MQKVGAEALRHARANTFHYPSPKPGYNPSSDEQLGSVLAGMSDRRPSVREVDHDSGGRVTTLTFADEVALALAMGRHAAPEDDEFRRQIDLTRIGATAFARWAEHLLAAYVHAIGRRFATGEIVDPPDR